MSQHHIHRYEARCRWDGSTALGYESYGRTHEGALPPASGRIELSADPAFRGDPTRANPEQLLVLAAASCQLLSFLAVAARARIDVRGYDDEAEGFMPEDTTPVRVSKIRLRPRITVGPGTSHQHLARLVQRLLGPGPRAGRWPGRRAEGCRVPNCSTVAAGCRASCKRRPATPARAMSSFHSW